MRDSDDEELPVDELRAAERRTAVKYGAAGMAAVAVGWFMFPDVGAVKPLGFSIGLIALGALFAVGSLVKYIRNLKSTST